MRREDIVTPSTNLLTGIAPSRDCRSARRWLSDTECIWNRGIWRQARSTSASEQCVALHTKPPTLGFSVRIWRPEYGRVKGVKKLGVRLGNWLTSEQGNALWQAPNPERLRGKRDRALLAILLACGLRRHEIAELTLDHFQKREEHWANLDLVGKGGHIRTIPVPDWVYRLLNDWMSAAGIQGGRLFRTMPARSRSSRSRRRRFAVCSQGQSLEGWQTKRPEMAQSFAQFGEPGICPSHRRTVEIAAREALGHLRDSGAHPLPASLDPVIVDLLIFVQ